MSQHPNGAALFPKCHLCVEKRNRGYWRGAGPEQRGEPRWRFRCVWRIQLLCTFPPALWPAKEGWGGGWCGVLITPRPLFDPTDSMAVPPPGKWANSCMLMVMAHGPDVTADTWSGGKLSGAFGFLSSHVITTGCKQGGEHSWALFQLMDPPPPLASECGKVLLIRDV